MISTLRKRAWWLVSTLSMSSRAKVLWGKSSFEELGFSELVRRHKSSKTEKASRADGPQWFQKPIRELDPNQFVLVQLIPVLMSYRRVAAAVDETTGILDS